MPPHVRPPPGMITLRIGPDGELLSRAVALYLGVTGTVYAMLAVTEWGYDDCCRAIYDQLIGQEVLHDKDQPRRCQGAAEQAGRTSCGRRACVHHQARKDRRADHRDRCSAKTH